jgi:8-oxo-dGTP pyrophosphatase MutT (NUDIX family)
MKTLLRKILYYRGQIRAVGSRSIKFPFKQVSARALLLRRTDGAILGVRHRKGSRLSLPGGGVENEEGPEQALKRELDEEHILLIRPDSTWPEHFHVDYFHGYRELSFWFLITVDDIHDAPSPEIYEKAWVPQSEDPWHPGVRLGLVSLITQYAPELLQVQIRIE